MIPIGPSLSIFKNWPDSRITSAFFCLSGLDLLGALEEKTTAEQREGWIEWIWKLQSSEFTGKDVAEARIWWI
jgi:hypothetical protein